MSLIRVLITDDQALVCGALAMLLGLESDLKVVTQAGRGDEVLDTVRKRVVDVALVDIDMPGCSGLAVTTEVVDSDLPCRCLIVTTLGYLGYLSWGMEAGAAGFIAKDIPPEVLAEAIRKVRAGLRVTDPKFIQGSILLEPNPLIEREKEVLLATTTGADARGIATRLSLSEGTVHNYLSSAIAKTRARNRIEAARIVETNGWP